MNSNEVTLKTYQENFDKYISGTVQATSGSQKEWMERVLEYVDKDAPILEIGSAFGRDAKFIQENGYTNLTVTDAFEAAVATLKHYGFSDAKKLNILTDELDSEYRLVFASAVFLHFTEQEFRSVLDKLRRHLGVRGILAFTVKEGDGEEWNEAKLDAPRFFRFWREEPLRQVLNEEGYNVLDITNNQGTSERWLSVMCQTRGL